MLPPLPALTALSLTVDGAILEGEYAEFGMLARSMASMRRLRRLVLSDCGREQPHEPVWPIPFICMTGLTALELYSARFSDGDCALMADALPRLSLLQCLALGYDYVPPAVARSLVAALRHLTGLTRLDFTHYLDGSIADIQNMATFAASLGQLRRLEHFTLSLTHYASWQLDSNVALAPLSHLTLLDFDSVDLDSAAAAACVAAAACLGLQNLCIMTGLIYGPHGPMADRHEKCARAVCERLPRLTKLTALCLWMSPEQNCITILSDALRRVPSLRDLRLNGALDSITAPALAAVVPALLQLTMLSLGGEGAAIGSGKAELGAAIDRLPCKCLLEWQLSA